MAGMWDGVRYGFAPIYWLQVSGIPVIFIERATGLALPAGYTTEDASLVIDDSAAVGIEQINRDNGTAVSLDLSFKLLDTTATRDWLRAPSKNMRLTADLSATDVVMAVDDSTGWSNGDAAFLGMERLTIGTVASATSCTGLTRATVGTLAYVHQTGTTSQTITDRPLYWRGRDVTLWASPCDATGFCPGATLLTDAVMVWRGRVEEGPARAVDGFNFQAGSIDRITERALVATISGEVDSTSAKVAVSKGYQIQIALRANTAAGVQVFSYIFDLSPFGADADGDLLTFAEIRDRIVAAFAQAVTDESAGADIGAFKFWKYGSKHGDTYNAKVLVKADATITNFEIFVFLDGKQATADWYDYPAGWSNDGYVSLVWQTKGNPLAPGSPIEAVIPWLVTVKIDQGSPSDVPATGRLRVEAAGGARLFSYSSATASNAEVYLGGLVPIDGTSAYPTKQQMQGADAQILFTDEGAIPVMMLRCLMSSGNGERDATYDTLARGQGYGIDGSLVKTSSFTATSAPVNSLKGEVATGGETFAGLFGGTLGLFRKAVACIPDATATNGALKLTLVNVAPFGVSQGTTIADADLLSHDGDPVVSVKKAHSANVLAILRPFGGDGDGVDRFVFADNSRADAEGVNQVEYRVPVKDRKKLQSIAGQVAASHLAADQTTQAIEIRCPPWIVAEVGDVVRLNITHPSVWTWSSSPGATGYAGSARVVGRTIGLKSPVVILTLLIDAAIGIAELSPAALISNHAGTAAAPTTIDVPIQYKSHFDDALLAAGGNVWVLHYQPGQVETSTQKHEISAATSAAGVCRLTVASTSGGHSIDTTKESTLTLPTSAGGDITAWQAYFAHVDDGTNWG